MVVVDVFAAAFIEATTSSSASLALGDLGDLGDSFFSLPFFLGADPEDPEDLKIGSEARIFWGKVGKVISGENDDLRISMDIVFGFVWYTSCRNPAHKGYKETVVFVLRLGQSLPVTLVLKEVKLL